MRNLCAMFERFYVSQYLLRLFNSAGRIGTHALRKLICLIQITGIRMQIRHHWVFLGLLSGVPLLLLLLLVLVLLLQVLKLQQFLHCSLVAGCQFLAGFMELRNGNGFGGVIFSTFFLSLDVQQCRALVCIFRSSHGSFH